MFSAVKKMLRFNKMLKCKKLLFNLKKCPASLSWRRGTEGEALL
jgi:hypothetical protein